MTGEQDRSSVCAKARRGAVAPPAGNKTRITIRLDRDVVEWFKSKAEAQGGGNYQTMLNDALRAYTERQDESIEKLLRKIVREEITKASWPALFIFILARARSVLEIACHARSQQRVDE